MDRPLMKELETVLAFIALGACFYFAAIGALTSKDDPKW